MPVDEVKNFLDSLYVLGKEFIRLGLVRKY
jgi:hypothetical protein